MDLGLKGKVAVVLAASRGMGRASAHALAAEGCRLVAFLCSEQAGYITGTTVTIDGGATRTLL